MVVAKSAPTTGAAAPPPPPPPGPPAPPPPPPPMETTSNDVENQKSARADLLESLNQGDNITSNLRKVTDEEKTHKNPSLKSDGLVKSSAEAGQVTKTNTGPSQTNKPARTELDGKRR